MDTTYDDDFRDFRDLMEEPPGGDNYGRAATTDPNTLGRTLPLDVKSMQAQETLREGGWTIIHTSGGGAKASGMTSHRGDLHPHEYVDTKALLVAIEAQLGFTREEFRRVARPGRPCRADAARSAWINVRLAELHAQGSTFATLAKVLGVTAQALGERAERGAKSLSLRA